MRFSVVLAGVVAVTAPLSPAQDKPLAYVSSVKSNNAADAKSLSEYSPGGRYTATAITVASMLRTAYRLQDYQLVGAPAWISTQRFDIVATIQDTPPPVQIFLRTLLKDRFKLALHNESREMPRFVLILARKDGRLGPKLTKSSFDCAAYNASPHPPPEPGSAPTCGLRANAGALSGRAVPLTQLVTSLAYFANRFTIDKTGLTGGYDIDLTWTPDQIRLAGDVNSDLSGLSLFTALQEQLGLKLITEKGPVDVTVVDHLAEPSEN